MNIKRFLALTAMIFGVGFFGASSAFATVTCSNLSASSTWPSGNTTQKCEGTGTTAHSGLMQSTLEDLGNNGTDAASRLRENPINSSETVEIRIVEGTVDETVQYTTTSSDSSATVAANLAAAINNNGQVSTVAFAYSSGPKVYIYSFSGSTSYSKTDSTNITIALSDLGGNTEQAAISAQARTDMNWYDFANHDDYNDYSRLSSPQQGPRIDGNLTTGDIGLTEWYQLDTEKVTVVFESNILLTNNKVRHTTAHETGHQLDRIYGPALASVNKFSSSQEFIDALNFDINNMAAMNQCAEEASDGRAVDENGDPSGGYYASTGTTTSGSDGGWGGLFTGIKDANGTYICNGAEGLGRGVRTYPGTSIDVLKAAYPWFGDNWNKTGEIFAEEYAVLMGYTDLKDNSDNDIAGSDRLLVDSNAYVCTKLYVQTLTLYGRVPNASELASTGYNIPQTIIGGPDDGKLGTGTVFHRCDGNVDDPVRFIFGS